jgi:hypothetical protein
VGISVGALIMRVDRDSSGQISIDFLIGITIFIAAFMFLMVVIPSMFTPFQSNSDELTMMADRVAATLVEKSLVYQQTPTSPLMPGVVDIDTFDNTYKSDLSALYDTIGLDRNKYSIEVLLEWDALNPVTGMTEIQVGDSISDTTHNVGNQNVGQSRRFVLVRDSTLAGDDWPGRKAILVVRIWQWAY